MRSSRLTSSERQRHFLILLAAGCLTTMTGGLVAPVFPEMVQSLHLDPRWAGLLVSTHALTNAISTPICGILADRIGKLKVLIPSLFFYAVFGVATVLVQTLPPLIATRGLLGAASGGVAAATIGLLAAMYEGEERSRVLGYATSITTTAAIVFPLLGGWAGRTEWQHAFYIYALGLPLMAAVIWGFNKEPVRTASLISADERNQLGHILRQPEVLRLYVFVGVAALIMQTAVIYAPVYLKTVIGVGPAINGIVLALRAAGAAVVSAVAASRIAKRIGKHRAIALGYGLMAVAIFSIPFLHHLYLIMLVAIVFGVGFGIIVPNLYDLLAGLAPVQLRASVLAIGTGFNSLGLFCSPLILGPIWKSAGLPFVFYTASAIALLVSFLNIHVKEIVEPTPDP